MKLRSELVLDLYTTDEELHILAEDLKRKHLSRLPGEPLVVYTFTLGTAKLRIVVDIERMKPAYPVEGFGMPVPFGKDPSSEET